MFKEIYEGIADTIRETYWEAMENETEYTRPNMEPAWRASGEFLSWSMYMRKAAEMTDD